MEVSTIMAKKLNEHQNQREIEIGNESNRPLCKNSVKDCVSFSSQEDTSSQGITYVKEAAPSNDSNCLTSGKKEESISHIKERMSREEEDELSKQGMSLKKYTAEQLSRALTRIKYQRMVRRKSLVRQVEQIKKNTKQLQNISKKTGASSDEVLQISTQLSEYLMPDTADTISAFVTAQTMGKALYSLSDAGKAYMIQNQSEPTIENVYKAGYSTGRAGKKEVNDKKTPLSKEERQMIAESFGKENKEVLKQAEWLYQHHLPVTDQTIAYKTVLDQLQENVTPQQILKGIINSFASGQDVIQTNLKDVFDANQVGEVMEYDDIEAIRNQKRVLQETIRLSINASTNDIVSKAHHEEWAALEDQLTKLEEREKNYYIGLSKEQGIKGNNDTNLFVKSCEAIQEVKDSSASILAQSFLQRTYTTVSMLADVAVESYNYSHGYKQYEPLMTSPRADMGDSIEKAFQSVDSILRDLDLDCSQANQRAVRILGYNELEITYENVIAMKAYDSIVNDCMTAMSPPVVAQLIKEHKNPLQIPIKDLLPMVRQMQEENTNENTENYGRFLVELSEHNEITEKEKQSYIGIFRMLHQVQESKGAAVGALLHANKELTFQNLMTEIRTQKSGDVDYKIDDTKKQRTSKGYHNSITEQINTAFEDLYHYNYHLVSSLSKEMSYQSLMTWKQKYGLNLENTSLEQLEEDIRDQRYTNIFANDAIINAQDAEEAEAFLSNYDVIKSVEMVAAAKEMLQNNRQIYKNSSFNRTKNFVSLLDVPEQFKTTYELEQMNQVEAMKNQLYQSDITVSKAKNIALYMDLYSLNVKLAKKEHYNIPVAIEKQLINVNLTIIHEANEKAKVVMTVPLEDKDCIKASFSVDKEEISGSITAETSEGLQLLQDKLQALNKKLSQANIKKVTLRIDNKQQTLDSFIYASGEIYKQSNKETEKEKNVGEVSTKQLYHIAKIVIETLTQQEKGKDVV